MSKARLVITAVTVEKRPVSEVIADYGVSKSWVYELLARYRDEGEAAFEPRSRRPHNSPHATPSAVVELILELREKLAAAGLDAGPDTIAWHLTQHHQTAVSRATIARQLAKAGLVTREPKKRPKSSYLRFEAAMPNETWQSDFTHYRLATGLDVEIITWLDDCSRYALHISAHLRITGPIVAATFRETAGQHGIPAATLTDNGMVYTARFSGGRGTDGNARNALEIQLHTWNVVQKNSRPSHPTTCGKVERFQQTLKKWLRSQPVQPSTTAELDTLLQTFADHYNHRRPHRSLPHRATPAALYDTMPKALPGPARSADGQGRVRHDRIDKSGTVTLRVAGKLRHIGIGRTHARTHVILLINNQHVRVVNAITGELLRELTIDLTKDYQPRN